MNDSKDLSFKEYRDPHSTTKPARTRLDLLSTQAEIELGSAYNISEDCTLLILAATLLEWFMSRSHQFQGYGPSLIARLIVSPINVL